MTAAVLLERLPNAREVASGRWRSGCPACGGSNNQKVAIRELSDGTVLVKGFCGCGAIDIIGAVGLQIRDLFPEAHRAPIEGRRSQKPGHWHATKQAMQSIQRECVIAAIAAEDAAAGRPLSQEDAARVIEAAKRIRDAVGACL